MSNTLIHIENQLRKRLQYPYKWYRKQNNVWDKYTHFIYTISEWEPLIQAIKKTVSEKKIDKKECFYYAINRWYNYWSSVAVEAIFCEQNGVIAAKNPKNKKLDFFIHEIPFDHKTSVFPRRYPKSWAYAKQYKTDLLYWLYNNQSQEARKHHANRLFLIVSHWKLKAEIFTLKQSITKYVATFDASKLETLQFSTTEKAVSDIIWVEQ